MIGRKVVFAGGDADHFTNSSNNGPTCSAQPHTRVERSSKREQRAAGRAYLRPVVNVISQQHQKHVGVANQLPAAVHSSFQHGRVTMQVRYHNNLAVLRDGVAKQGPRILLGFVVGGANNRYSNHICMCGASTSFLAYVRRHGTISG